MPPAHLSQRCQVQGPPVLETAEHYHSSRQGTQHRNTGGACTAHRGRATRDDSTLARNPQPPRVHHCFQRGQARGRQRPPDPVIGDAPPLLSPWPAPHTRPATKPPRPTVLQPRRTRALAPPPERRARTLSFTVLSSRTGREWRLGDRIPSRTDARWGAKGRGPRARLCSQEEAA